MSLDISSMFIRASEGDSTFLARGEFLTWKATGETTDGKYDQVEVVTLPGSGPAEHTHTQDELFYFLAGNYKMKVGDHVFTGIDPIVGMIQSRKFHLSLFRSPTFGAIPLSLL